MPNIWDLLFRLLPQVMAAAAAIQARGGHGIYDFDLDVRDKATGLDVIPEVTVAEVTL